MTYMYTCIAQPRRGSIIWCYDWWSAHGYRPLFTAILNWKLVHHPIEDVFTMIKYPCGWSEESLKKEVATKQRNNKWQESCKNSNSNPDSSANRSPVTP